jgi:hypothetical protein
MGKASRKKRARRNKEQVNRNITPQKTLSHFLLGWKLLVSLFSLLAIASGILALLPRPSVTASEFIKANEPFSTPFVISNESYLPIHDVNYKCAIRHYRASDGGNIIAYEGGIVPSGFVLPEMSPGESTTVSCPFPFKGWEPVVSAGFDFVLEYRPDFLPWAQEKRFRFETGWDKDGSLKWYSRSMSEN